MKRQGGFTMVELMVTVLVLAILTTIAAPSFSDFIRRSAVTSRTNDVLAGLNLARSTAVSRSVLVSVCASTDTSAATPTCSGANDFSKGWLVYTSTEAGKAFGTGDELVRVWQANDSVSVLGPGVVTFNARGAPSAGALHLVVCAKSSDATVGQSRPRSAGRRIDVQGGGRASATALGTGTSDSDAESPCQYSTS